MYDFIEQHDGYTVSRKFYNSTDRRLGRNVNHDSRSLNYLVEAQDVSTLVSVRHDRVIPVLDQGNLGSCVGNAGTGALGSAFFWAQGEDVLDPSDAAVDESYAVGLYSECTSVDPYTGTYPPSDTGTDGLSCAKVLLGRGLISGYQHCTSFEAFATALAQQPVLVGIEWHEASFDPDADGRCHIDGDVMGGHEIIFDELDMENQRVWFTNSWTADWGVNGRAYFTFEDITTLLSHEGDATVLVPVTEPAPQPTPPEPTPTPEPELDPLQQLLHIAKRLVHKIEAYIESQ